MEGDGVTEKGKERIGEFVVTSGDTAKLFDLAGTVFDVVSLHGQPVCPR